MSADSEVEEDEVLDPSFSIRDAARYAERQMADELPGWRAAWWQYAGDGRFVVKGAVSTRYRTRGPRKGEPHWPAQADPTWREVSIMNEDVVAMLIEEEAKSGKCAHCKGSGQQWAGSDTQTQGCLRCKATGVAPGARTT